MKHLASAAISRYVPSQKSYSSQPDNASTVSSNISTRTSSKLSSISSKRSQFAQPRTSALTNTNDSLGLQRVNSNQSHQSIQSNSTQTANHFGNYTLNRVESTVSLESAFSAQSRFRVSLEFTAKEISLLRYMWNKMLGEESTLFDDPAAASMSGLHIPGSLVAQAQTKPAAGHAQSSAPRQVFGASSTFCSQFYSNLLAMDPSLETAFPSLRHQAVSMAGVLSLAVNSLENLRSLDNYLVELANRHSRILGIEPAQFELMGEAFIMTFHERFGTRFTHDLELLWIKFYMYLANSLLQFGLDPVMKIAGDTHDFNAGSSDSIYTRDTAPDSDIGTRPNVVGSAGLDSASMASSARKISTSTDFTSVASTAKPQQTFLKGVGLGSAPPKSGKGPSSYSGILGQATSGQGASVSQSDNTKKKKGRLSRKKGECVVM